MNQSEEQAGIDAEWDLLLASTETRSDTHAEAAARTDEAGAFGHDSERRLGMRVPATCWALLRDGAQGVYAQTVELSATGVLLKLVDGRDVQFNTARSLDLDLFLPDSTGPLHATARHARAVGSLEAFELSGMNAADRLTLAEHLDHLAAHRPSAAPPASEARRPAPAAWRHFVRSLAQTPHAAQAQRF